MPHLNAVAGDRRIGLEGPDEGSHRKLLLNIFGSTQRQHSGERAELSLGTFFLPYGYCSKTGRCQPLS